MDYVLDASAMIAFLRGERGAEVVEQALNPQNRCFAHSLNLCEVYYDFFRATNTDPAALDTETAVEAVRDLTNAGVIERSDMDEYFWFAAGTLKAVYRRVSLADCFSLALSGRLRATILTADHHEFDVLVQRGVKDIEFIR